MEEFLEDEEEDVVCSALEALIQLIKNMESTNEHPLE